MAKMISAYLRTKADRATTFSILAKTIRQTFGVVILLCAMTLGAAAQIAPTNGPEAMAMSPAMRAWRQHTSARIKRMANRLADTGLRGQAIICLAVNRNGRMVETTVLRSSGNPELDGAALTVVRMAGPFAPLPSTYTKPVLAIGVPLNFRSAPSDFGAKRAERVHGMIRAR